MWRSLLVTYPDAIVAYTRQQTCYFGDAGPLRRLDYAVDILGGGSAGALPVGVSRVRRDHGPPPAAGSTFS